MAFPERRPNETASGFTPQCQKTGCSHRDCAEQNSSHACPSLFWCPQCTRFWCGDCWEDVDAHQPIDVEISGMVDHEKTLFRIVSEIKVLPQHEGLDIEGDFTRRLTPPRQEQNNARGNKRPRYPQGPPSRVRPRISRDEWAESPNSLYERRREQREYQHKRRAAPTLPAQGNIAERTSVDDTPSNPVYHAEPDTAERNQTEPPVSWDSAPSAFQSYQTQMTLLEQQKRNRV